MQGDFSDPGRDIFDISGTGFNSNEEWWEFVGRHFYILYWVHLLDLGQSEPEKRQFDHQNSMSPLVSAASNIFANETLYQNYLTYVHNLYTLRNMSTQPASTGYIQTWLWNSLLFFTPIPSDTMFLQSYSCQQRVLKSPVNFLISVIAADYALIVGAYSLTIWVAGSIQKRQKNGN